MSIAKSVQTQWDIAYPAKIVGRAAQTKIAAAVPNLQSDVFNERNILGPPHYWPTREQLGALLNKVAWKHRNTGVGLSAKPNGYNVPMPFTNRMIASDILHFRNENVLIDCLISAGEISQPTWEQVVHHNDLGRPWVEPVDPQDVIIVEPPIEQSDLEGRVGILENKINNIVFELQQVVDRLNVDKPIEVDVEQVVRLAIQEYEIKGRTSSVFAHQHNIQLSLQKRKG